MDLVAQYRPSRNVSPNRAFADIFPGQPESGSGGPVAFSGADTRIAVKIRIARQPSIASASALYRWDPTVPHTDFLCRNTYMFFRLEDNKENTQERNDQFFSRGARLMWGLTAPRSLRKKLRSVGKGITRRRYTLIYPAIPRMKKTNMAVRDQSLRVA
jgi:hypothetical protein